MAIIAQSVFSNTIGNKQTNCECALTGAPTPGNYLILGCITNVTGVNVVDSQANYWQLINKTTQGNLTTSLYGALITSSAAPLSAVFHTTAMYVPGTNAQISAIMAEIPANQLGFPTGTLQSISSINTGSGLVGVGSGISFIGNGFDIGLFSTSIYNGGNVSVGSGYTLIASISGTSSTYGLAMVAKSQDATSFATPFINYSNSVPYTSVCSVITNPPCWLSPSGSLNIPVAPVIPSFASNNYGWQPVQQGVSNSVTVSAIGAQWASQPSFSSNNGSVSVNSFDITSQKATLTVTPSTTGVVILTDSITGATCKVQSCNYYYVSTAGSDSTGNGSQSTPWHTLGYTIAHSSPYDTILLNGGDTAADATFPLVVTSYRYFSSYGTGKGKISAGANLVALEASGCGMTVNNMQVTATMNLAGGLRLILLRSDDGAVHTDGYVVSNCTVSGAYTQVGAVCGNNNTATRVKYCYIYNNDLTGGFLGIGLYAGNPNNTPVYSCGTIAGNYIHDVPGQFGMFNGSWYPTDGPFHIYNNRITNVGSATTTAAGCWSVSCGQMRWRGNVVDRMIANGTGATNFNDGQAFDIDTNSIGVIVEYNLSFNNQGYGYGIYTGGTDYDNIVRYNMSIDDVTLVHLSSNLPVHAGAIELANDVPVLIVGNLVMRSIYTPGDYCHALNFRNAGASVKVYNNIFLQAAGQTCWCINTSGPGYNGDNNYFQSGTGRVKINFAGTIYTNWASFLSAWQGVVGGWDNNSIAAKSAELYLPRPTPNFSPGNLSALAPTFAWIAGAPQFRLRNYLSTLGIAYGGLDLAGNAISTSGFYPIGPFANSTTPSTYESTIQTDTPFSRWRLNEGSGTVFYDSMLSQNSGNITSITFNSGIINNNSQVSATFNGTNSQAILPYKTSTTTSIFTAGGFSAELWCSPSVINNTVYPVSSNVNTSGAWSVGITSLGDLNINLTDGVNTLTGSTAGLGLTSGKIYHIVTTLSGTLSAYVNGSPVSLTVNGNAPSGMILSGVNIGVGSGNTGFFPGQIQDVMLYDYALPSGRVNAHYLVGAFPTPSPTPTPTPSPTPTPIVNGGQVATSIFRGGSIFGGGLLSDNLAFNNTAMLNYPYFGIRSGHSNNVPLNSTDVGVIPANSGSQFDAMVKGKYVILTFSSIVSPAKYNVHSSNPEIGFVNTKLTNKTGGWHYNNGLPINGLNTRDNIHKESSTNMNSPGRFTFLQNNFVIDTQNFSPKNN